MVESIAEERDVLIIGGGPAGLSASLWCADLGLTSTVFESGAELGGQLLKIHSPITNYLGAECSNGRELRDRFVASFGHVSHEHLTNREIVDVDLDGRTVQLSDLTSIAGRSMIIATGVRRRVLGVAGEREFVGKGILDSGAKERKTAAGKTVAVIGGGDAAVENALLLADFADKVILVHRGSSVSARDEFVRRALEHPRIEFRLNSVVERFDGGTSLKAIAVIDSVSDHRSAVNIDLAVVRIGVEPNTEFLRDQLELDSRGFVSVDKNCQTSKPRVYAVGDVASPLAPTIAGAVGSGATAAKAISSCLSPRTHL